MAKYGKSNSGYHGDVCPECRGAGEVTLLTSSGPCRRCGGTGRTDAAGGVKAGEHDACVRTFDEQGRLVCAVWPDGRTASYSYYGSAGDALPD